MAWRGPQVLLSIPVVLLGWGGMLPAIPELPPDQAGQALANRRIRAVRLPAAPWGPAHLEAKNVALPGDHWDYQARRPRDVHSRFSTTTAHPAASYRTKQSGGSFHVYSSPLLPF